MHRQQGGFTIVESMIVLAVTGSMFLMAVLFVTGKQADEQFRQAVRDFETKITDVANDVATGTYVKPEGCTKGPGSAPQPSGGSIAQGTDSDCIFIGKALRFHANGFSSYSVLGRRLDEGNGNAIVSDLDSANPRLFSTTVEDYTIPWQVTIRPQGVFYAQVGGVGPGGNPTNLLGIYNCFGNDTSCSGNNGSDPTSAGGGIRPVYYNGNVSDASQAASSVQTENDRPISVNDRLNVCLEDGERRALVAVDLSGGNVTALSTIGRSAC